ncbi:hypothetical protein L6164_033596 [Bauhinia variegata]|uniref:Uncharacterized protein n=1 Tax=Bauhinia variegata TaxID=167791 RepID=A0ACB9KT13_BAUVA|nr:hypothetical protein L6164_033596 [Bauhinia variegata]
MQQRRPPFIAALVAFLLLGVYASAQGALDQLPLVGKHLGHPRSGCIGGTHQNQQGQTGISHSGGIANTIQNQPGRLSGRILNTNRKRRPTQRGQAGQSSGGIPNTNQNQNPIQQVGQLLGGILNTNQKHNGANTNQNQAALIQEFLFAHNLVRKVFNEPPFTWDDNLAMYAQTHAAKLYNECKMIHSNGNYGENIFWGLIPHWTPSEAIKFWYEEYKDYDFSTHTCAIGKKCGHFTQMVWRDSVRLGCAVLHCRPGLGMLIICEYDPPGNYENENPLDNNNAK